MTFPTEAELAQRVEQLRRQADGLDGLALLQNLLGGALAGRVALVSSFGAESAVLLDLVARVDTTTPVIFLDTGKLFNETLAYRDALVARLGLRIVRTLHPHPRDLAQFDPDGNLWDRDPDHCCFIRKTEPLDAALAPFEAWITGRKGFHSDTRATVPAIEGDPVTGKIKLNPLIDWSVADIEAYLIKRNLPRHPLVAAGYPSIGCQPCTRAARPGEDIRAGRWAGRGKNECGIHRPGL
ncbi:phosphoadenosine phosphosulfate reductase [uncultured Gammaproteobacteria bacterium]